MRSAGWTSDNVDGSRHAVHHLVGLGRTRIAAIAGAQSREEMR
jgi:DNA-binding LacI/PurR family transcriptional regulator